MLAYAAIVGTIYTSQDDMIFPGRRLQGTPEAVIRPVEGAELVRLRTAEGEPVVGLFGPALTPDGGPRPDADRALTMLYCYGNGRSVATMPRTMAALRRGGLNVMMVDYLGFGMSGGDAGERGCYAAVEAAYDHLRGRPDVDPRRIVIEGVSLGAGVAIDLAAKREAAALVVLAGATGFAELAQAAYPWLPTGLLLRHRFDSLSKIGRVRCPTLLVHCRDDEVIPFRMMERLAAAAGGPTTTLAIDRGGHVGAFAAHPAGLFGVAFEPEAIQEVDRLRYNEPVRSFFRSLDQAGASGGEAALPAADPR